MSGKQDFTHFDESGKARMVDVAHKSVSKRVAVAKCLLRMQPVTMQQIRHGTLSKGDALAVARVAAIMAAKRTPDLIPLCHPLSISSVDIQFQFIEDCQVEVCSTVTTTDRTGVEMEAMTSAAICGLTIYDMCKSVDREIEIISLFLESKSGGERGDYTRGSGGNE